MHTWVAAAAAAVAMATATGCSDDDAVSPTTLPASTTTTTAPVRVDDGVLRIGLLLPQSGESAEIGQPLIDAAELAVQQINEAGGVRGEPVEVVAVDEGANAVTATDAIDELIDRGVDAVVGPASSTVALATLDDLLGANVLTCSPTATSLALDGYPDSELFFRTAPSDSLQAAAIARLADETGARTVAVAYLDDVYGRPLAEETIAALRNRGLVVTDPVEFAADDQSLVDQASAIGESGASAIVVIGDADHGMRMLAALSETAGSIDTAEPPTIIVNDALRRPPANLVTALGAAVLDHLTGVSPRARPQQPEEPLGAFATNAYNCVNLIALAAVQAAVGDGGGLPEPEAMAAELVAISDSGSPCSDFGDCIVLLGEELNFDYDGPGPDVQIGPDGDLVEGWFDVFRFDDAGVDVSTTRQLLVP